MKQKNFGLEKKIFIYLGIPCLIFVFYVMFNFYLLFSFSYAIFFIVLCLGLISKKNFYNRMIKISVIMVIIFFINFYNIFLVPSQLVRHSYGGRQNLLEPEHPEIKKLKDKFLTWHLETYNVSFDDLDDNNREELELKLMRLDYYIRNKIFEYTPDSEAPYYTSEHVASLDEIFASDMDGDGLLQDDCDGITVLTVSLLLNMNYNAFVAECSGHWNSIVFPKGCNPKTEEGFKQGIHLYNPWKRPSYYIFNQTEVIIPPGRPLYLSMYELLLDDNAYWDYVYFILGYYLDLPIFLNILILYGIFILLGFIIFHIVRIGIPEMPSIKKKKIKWFFSKDIFIISFKLSLIASFVGFLVFWFVISNLGSLVTIILSLSFIFAFRYTEYAIKLQSKKDKN